MEMCGCANEQLVSLVAGFFAAMLKVFMETLNSRISS